MKPKADKEAIIRTHRQRRVANRGRILHVRLLNRRVGDQRARQIGVFTRCAIILAIARIPVPWIGISSIRQALGVGFMWLVVMLALEVGLGRFVAMKLRRML